MDFHLDALSDPNIKVHSLLQQTFIEKLNMHRERQDMMDHDNEKHICLKLNLIACKNTIETINDYLPRIIEIDGVSKWIKYLCRVYNLSRASKHILMSQGGHNAKLQYPELHALFIEEVHHAMQFASRIILRYNEVRSYNTYLLINSTKKMIEEDTEQDAYLYKQTCK
jgi:hypothetical protein